MHHVGWILALALVACAPDTDSGDPTPGTDNPDPGTDPTTVDPTEPTTTDAAEPCDPDWPVGLQTTFCVPDFTLPDADGNDFTLSDLRGDHVVVVDLVAMWCGPCWNMADDLEGLYQSYREDGLEVVTLIGEDQAQQNPTVADAAEWRDTGSLSSTIVVDVDGTVKHEWSRSGNFDNIPMTYVVSREGTLVYFASDGELGMARLEEMVQMALASDDSQD